MTAREIIDIYLSFFEKRGHTKIAGAPLVPLNDPTTLFTSSGMQPLITYLLGESHPSGKRLVNVQNCFRAQDIDEIGNNRHTTFFRMLGNWSLGDYFKTDQLPWFWEFLTKELGLKPEKLFVTVFEGDKALGIPKDETCIAIWEQLFTEAKLDPKKRIFEYGVEKNWWSRSGTPDKMPPGEPGGPDSEVFYDFGAELKLHENSEWKNEKCHVNCDCGRFMEIGNSVFMQYQKQADGTFKELPQRNVDFGGGLERLVAATENQVDVFQTSLFKNIIAAIETITSKSYKEYKKEMRITADHLTASIFIVLNSVNPSNKEQGYILRRLIRRALDNINTIRGMEQLANPTKRILEAIIDEYRKTDPVLEEKSQPIIDTILEELNKYRFALTNAQRFIEKKYKRTGDELLGTTEISAEDAFVLYTTHGLSPTQIKSLGYTFDDQTFAQKMEEHQKLSRTQSASKFKGGLADTQELTIKGHTATHLLHQAIRDLLGTDVHQSGSNITAERVRFDFNFDRKLTDEEIKKLENVVNEKIKADLPVHFEILPLKKAQELKAIGLFGEKYDATVKVYFIGGSGKNGNYNNMYSKEFCGGPHVDRTSEIKSFNITKQEKIGTGYTRLYAVVK